MSQFYNLLEAYARADSTQDRTGIEAEIWDRFGREQAIFVLDLSGFSLSTAKHGIVHYLSKIQRMRMTLAPLISHNGGSVVKFEADNCFARFPETLDAVRTAINYNHTLDAMNLTTPEDLDIQASIGIDFGKFLLVEKEDIYGMPVNIASKLGEDAAGIGQILVTKNAMARIDNQAGIKSQPIDISISGMAIAACDILY